MNQFKHRHRAAILLIDHENILLIRRVQKGHEYYVTPGGGIKKNETPEAAAIREAAEETSLTVRLSGNVWKHTEGEQKNYFFEVFSYFGNLELGGPERKKMGPNNQYHLEWVPLGKLQEIPLKPDTLKQHLLTDHKQA